jgi:hypothetical protein
MKFGYIVFAKFLLFSHGGLARGLRGVLQKDRIYSHGKFKLSQ